MPMELGLKLMTIVGPGFADRRPKEGVDTLPKTDLVKRIYCAGLSDFVATDENPLLTI